MKILVLCIVLSLTFPLCLASPVNTQINEKTLSSELHHLGETLSASEEDQQQEISQKKDKLYDSNEEDNVADTNEEIENSNLEDEKEQHYTNDGINALDDIEIFKRKKTGGRSRRAINFASHAYNQLVVKNEESKKYDKYNGLSEKTMRLRRSMDESSEEDSSEEEKKSKDPVAGEQSGKSGAATVEREVIVHKADITENRPKPEEKVDVVRHRRNLDLDLEDQSENEVFIFSNENKNDSVVDITSAYLKYNEYIMRINEKNLDKSKPSLKNIKSDEDYAQGCGGNSNSQDDDSNENSDELN